MKTLRSLLNKLISMPFKKPNSYGHQTIVHPKLGQPIVIYDSLYFGQTASDQQLNELYEFWKAEDISFDHSSSPELQDLGLDVSFPVLEINPCTGLPMFNNAIDVAGNPYGTSIIEQDLS